MQADDMELLREFATGNSQQAFTTLVQRHINLVYSVALRRLGNAHEAEEVTQEVLRSAVRHPGPPAGASADNAWLHRLTLRAVVARRRRTGTAAPTAAEEPPRHRLSELLRVAVATLPAIYQQVLVLADFEGRSLAEIADRRLAAPRR